MYETRDDLFISTTKSQVDAEIGDFDGPGKSVEAPGITKELYGGINFTSPLHLLQRNAGFPKQIDALPRIGIPNKGIWTERLLCAISYATVHN